MISVSFVSQNTDTPNATILRFVSSSDAELAGWYERQSRNATPVATTPHMGLADHLRLSSSTLDERMRLTRTALGLANWTLLLWDTPWTRGICSYRIGLFSIERETEAESSGHFATFTAAVNCNKRSGETHMERKALMLGTTLAEIGLRQLLRVGIGGDGAPCFWLRSNDQPVSKHSLLEKVEKERGRPFMAAIRYCFRYDKESMRQGRSFHPYDIIRFKENVIDVLEAYWPAEREHEAWQRRVA
ncbi:hypothetical protein QBC46DRAFT_391695 [Diplogelasinospora grovesii]|uniref:Uncharacterized protein n=1 Tax=Diplogelasinospora grovesii TaxID=303347 RepID=A0AAN6N291_9PEZI|nr:hypothetical protein QBC46DRAFT_391695 [Diplogelasinospora grovesii]